MNTKVSVKEKICYGIGSGGGNIITQILGTFLTAYYTDSVGIAAAAVGTMIFGCKTSGWYQRCHDGWNR